jgi:hypothetical protein
MEISYCPHHLGRVGLMPGVVGPYASDNVEKVRAAERSLNLHIRKQLSELKLDDRLSSHAQQLIRETEFKTWFTQANPFAESAWQLFVAIPNDSHAYQLATAQHPPAVLH